MEANPGRYEGRQKIMWKSKQAEHGSVGLMAGKARACT